MTACNRYRISSISNGRSQSDTPQLHPHVAAGSSTPTILPLGGGWERLFQQILAWAAMQTNAAQWKKMAGCINPTDLCFEGTTTWKWRINVRFLQNVSHEMAWNAIKYYSTACTCAIMSHGQYSLRFCRKAIASQWVLLYLLRSDFWPGGHAISGLSDDG